MRVAVLEDGKVVNIIVADAAFAEANLTEYRVLKDGEWCDIGATWDGKKFIPADPIEE